MTELGLSRAPAKGVMTDFFWQRIREAALFHRSALSGSRAEELVSLARKYRPLQFEAAHRAAMAAKVATMRTHTGVLQKR